MAKDYSSYFDDEEKPVGHGVLAPTEEETRRAEEASKAKPAKPEISGYETAGVHGAQGMLAGFGDELAGVGAAVGSLVPDFIKRRLQGEDALGNVVETDKSAGDAYRGGRQDARDYLEETRAANPKTAVAAQIGGGVVSGLATGSLAAGSRLAQVGVAAGEGAAAGLGHSEADVTKGELGKAARDTAVGAVVSAAIPAAAGGIAAGIERRAINKTAKEIAQEEAKNASAALAKLDKKEVAEAAAQAKRAIQEKAKEAAAAAKVAAQTKAATKSEALAKTMLAPDKVQVGGKVWIKDGDKYLRNAVVEDVLPGGVRVQGIDRTFHFQQIEPVQAVGKALSPAEKKAAIKAAAKLAEKTAKEDANAAGRAAEKAIKDEAFAAAKAARDVEREAITSAPSQAKRLAGESAADYKKRILALGKERQAAKDAAKTIGQKVVDQLKDKAVAAVAGGTIGAVTGNRGEGGGNIVTNTLEGIGLGIAGKALGKPGTFDAIAKTGRYAGKAATPVVTAAMQEKPKKDYSSYFDD